MGNRFCESSLVTYFVDPLFWVILFTKKDKILSSLPWLVKHTGWLDWGNVLEFLLRWLKCHDQKYLEDYFILLFKVADHHWEKSGQELKTGTVDTVKEFCLIVFSALFLIFFFFGCDSSLYQLSHLSSPQPASLCNSVGWASSIQQFIKSMTDRLYIHFSIEIPISK